MDTTTSRSDKGYRLTGAECDLAEFQALVERITDPADYPHAALVEQNVPVYDSTGPATRENLQANSPGRC